MDKAIPIRAKCVRCGGVLRRYTIQLIAPNNPTPYWPKWVPRIKEICVGCNQYVRFSVQTPELIEAFNNQLTDIAVNDDV